MVVKKALIFMSFAGMVMFVACTDVSETIGKDLVSNESNLDLYLTDTVTVETYSIEQNAIANSGSGPHLLGSINDPVFGKTKASIYSKFLINSGFDSLFHAAEYFDSIVLSLSYSGHYYGDTLIEQTVRIYELEENLDDSIQYLSDKSVLYNPIEIASHTFNPLPTTNVTVVGGVIEPQLRIKISTSSNDPFASKLLSIISENYLELDSALGYSIILNDEFYEFFNGLYISTDPVDGSDGALIGINLFGASTSLELFKHDTVHGLTKDGQNDSILVENQTSSLTVSSISSSTFNNYDHLGFANADNSFFDQVINGNKELGKEQVYIQSLAGSRLRVKFPYIQDLKNLGSKIAINKAELILCAAEDISLPSFDAPEELGAQIQFVDDSVLAIPDIVFGSSFFGGSLDTLTNEYRFRITRYIQESIENLYEGEDGLYIFSAPEYNSYSRVLLVGSNPSLPVPFSKRARLEITYTIIE